MRPRADILSPGMGLHFQLVTSALVRDGRDAPPVKLEGRTPSSEMTSRRDRQSDELIARREISA
jgi:hypothetical protein